MTKATITNKQVITYTRCYGKCDQQFPTGPQTQKNTQKKHNPNQEMQPNLIRTTSDTHRTNVDAQQHLCSVSCAPLKIFFFNTPSTVKEFFKHIICVTVFCYFPILFVLRIFGKFPQHICACLKLSLTVSCVFENFLKTDVLEPAT